MASDPNLENPWWKENPLRIAGGWHPIAGRLRADIQSENIEDDYAWEFTEEHIVRLKALGITVLIGQFDRGLGETDQAEQYELARTQAALCHKHGIRHGVYLPNTVYYESALKDHPDCEDWVVKTALGRKTFYGGEQTWRWEACMNSPGWRERMKWHVEKAIRFVETDLLHFDNTGLSLEPDGCHCDYCETAFRQFLERRYPDERSQTRRFGYPGFDTFRIPHFWDPYTQPWDLNRIQSPLLQEWLQFRCATVRDYLRDMTTYARSLQADICIDCNGQSLHGYNAAMTQGRGDQEGQLEAIDVMWEENPDLRPDDEPGAIFPSARHFRGMLFARRLNVELITGYHDEEELAFNLTFCGNPGIHTTWGYAEPGRKPLDEGAPGVEALLAHVEAHAELYRNCRPGNRLAVWRNQQSLMYVTLETALSAAVIEYLLFSERIPFSIVQDSFIDASKLADFDTVILPNVEFVSDQQAEVLRAFVKGGGRLLITERSGVYTSEPRRRLQPVFADWFGDGETGAQLASIGDGRAAWLPAIDYVHGPGAFESKYNQFYNGIDSRYWKRPHNASEIIGLLEWLTPDLQPVKVHGVPELRLDYHQLADGSMAVPMVRCGDINGPCDVPFSVTSAPQGAHLYVRGADPQPLTFTKHGGRYETILTGIERHAVVRYRCEI